MQIPGLTSPPSAPIMSKNSIPLIFEAVLRPSRTDSPECISKAVLASLPQPSSPFYNSQITKLIAEDPEWNSRELWDSLSSLRCWFIAPLWEHILPRHVEEAYDWQVMPVETE